MASSRLDSATSTTAPISNLLLRLSSPFPACKQEAIELDDKAEERREGPGFHSFFLASFDADGAIVHFYDDEQQPLLLNLVKRVIRSQTHRPPLKSPFGSPRSQKEQSAPNYATDSKTYRLGLLFRQIGYGHWASKD